MPKIDREIADLIIEKLKPCGDVIRPQQVKFVLDQLVSSPPEEGWTVDLTDENHGQYCAITLKPVEAKHKPAKISICIGNNETSLFLNRISLSELGAYIYDYLEWLDMND